MRSIVQVRPAATGDADDIARIYNPFIAETTITFEEAPVTGEEMVRRINEVADAGLPWLVAEDAVSVVGFAYASRWKGRCAYRHSAEVTVYVDRDEPGRGIGSALYEALLRDLQERGTHTALGGIALPNDPSIRLHEKFGFRKVAHLEQVGFKFGRWVDVGYWQRVF